MGIELKDQERIFARFERAVPGSKISGFGLGLSIASDILRSHAGTISVEGQPGEGARFIVTLSVLARDSAALRTELKRDLS